MQNINLVIFLDLHVHIIALWQNVLLINIKKKTNYLQYTYGPEDQVC